MVKLWALLDQAHHYIDEKRYEDARDVLEKIINHDPQNVDAWNTYISITTTQRGLEKLRDLIKYIWTTRVKDNDYLFANQRFVLQRLDDKIDSLHTY